MPFGLASAPRVYTKLLRPLAPAMRKKGIRMLIFNEILVLAQKETTLKKHMVTVAETLS